jgi:DNA-binding MarR family transcriptional regulator
VTLQEWRWQIVQSELTPPARHVLLTLGLHMKADQTWCWPSIPRLSRLTGLAESTVKKATSEADKAGLIERKHGTGRGRSTEYHATYKNVRLADALAGENVRLSTRKTSGSRPRSNNEDDGSRLNGSAVCDECDIGGGYHAADCSKSAVAG